LLHVFFHWLVLNTHHPGWNVRCVRDPKITL